MQCETLVTACIANEAPEEECVAGGLCIVCFECLGGMGGNGGNGGNGGMGGSNGGPFCDEGLCVDDTVAMDCQTAVAACIAAVGEARTDECVAGGDLLYCNVEEE